MTAARDLYYRNGTSVDLLCPFRSALTIFSRLGKIVQGEMEVSIFTYPKYLCKSSHSFGKLHYQTLGLGVFIPTTTNSNLLGTFISFTENSELSREQAFLEFLETYDVALSSLSTRVAGTWNSPYCICSILTFFAKENEVNLSFSNVSY